MASAAAGVEGPSTDPMTVPANASQALGGIGLQMTECEVVSRAGVPDNIEFGAGGTERVVSLTYLGGPRPGIYRFSTGRLYSIERAPEAPRQQRPPAKKSNRA